MRKQYPSNLSDCCLCEIRDSATQVVQGHGPKPADIMFVGQNPGISEDRDGKPFSDKSERILNRIIKAICFTPEEVYITNVVKCITPENRLPYEDEMKSCIYWFIKELKEVNPKVIVTIGVCAFQIVACAPIDIRITDYAGQVVESPAEAFKGIKILPLMHPASLIYNHRRNYEPYTRHVANLFGLLIDLEMIEPNSPDWREGFCF